MGAQHSRPYYGRAYVLPTDSFIQCPGGPIGCYCPHPHTDPRTVYMVPVYRGGRRRYLDPMQYVDRLTVNTFPGSGGLYANGPGIGGMGGLGGVNEMGGFLGGGADMGMRGFPFPYGGFGGLGWKDPRDWTTRDFECLQEVFGEMLARQRGRRGGRGGRRNDGGDDHGYDGDCGGYGGGHDGGGGGRGRNSTPDVLALLQSLDTARRLQGVETTVFGTEAQMREAAFRQRLYDIFGAGGDRSEDRGGNSNERGGMDIGDGGGGGGGNTDARLVQQRRDHERREREQRDLDREVEEIQRHLGRLREPGERAGGIGGGGPGGWRSVDEWPFG